MRILHYFLGPQRAGGLNRYARDLALAQQEGGHHPLFLTPSGTPFPPSTPRLRRGSPYRGIPWYRLQGGLPVPLLEGVRDPAALWESRRHLSPEALEAFWREAQPDVLHIHTWMGFPPELLTLAKARGCRVLFTAHDYYGLCPKVNFVNEAGCSCGGGGDEACTRCNRNAPGERMLALRNWELLLSCKKFLAPLARLARGLRKPRGGAGLAEGADLPSRPYGAWRRYHLELLSQCDLIHCNSQVTQGVYARYLPQGPFALAPITHGGIHWHPRMRLPQRESLRLGFSGPEAPFKGLPLLLETLRALPQKNWQLDIWGTGRKRREGPFHWRGNYRDVAQAFADLDLLIVPSLCNETFGFIVPEALSLGVPVLCSDTVGAQSLTSPALVYHGPEGLRQKLTRFLEHPEELSALRQALVGGPSPLQSMARHTEEILGLYPK